MGLFDCFKKKTSKMPIGAALDMLEKVRKAHPGLVLEWVEANPSRAQFVDGLADNATCRRFKCWDGPYSITSGVGELRGRVVNLFFQDLRRDVKALCEMVTKEGREEDQEGLSNDEQLIKDLQMVSLLSLMAISGDVLDLFPSLLNTESQYDSKSVVMAGMSHFYAFVRMKQGNDAYMSLELFEVIDKMREKERRLYKRGSIEYDFTELASNLLDNLDRYPKSLEQRAQEAGVDDYKVRALDIAGWVYFTLTKGRPVKVEREKYEMYLANLMISQIAWDMCGINKSC